MGKYDDIINLPHYKSEKRPHMSMRDRAAQFSPFAALTGFESKIDDASDTARNRSEDEINQFLNK